MNTVNRSLSSQINLQLDARWHMNAMNEWVLSDGYAGFYHNFSDNITSYLTTQGRFITDVCVMKKTEFFSFQFKTGFLILKLHNTNQIKNN